MRELYNLVMLKRVLLLVFSAMLIPLNSEYGTLVNRMANQLHIPPSIFGIVLTATTMVAIVYHRKSTDIVAGVLWVAFTAYGLFIAWFVSPVPIHVAYIHAVPIITMLYLSYLLYWRKYD
ncbi:hypothetical protein KDA23_03185 [Candidatus Saccharibacteria bacterium]|nr:hypothetical protein [Candidatus Saccharibacteria bacterium]